MRYLLALVLLYATPALAQTTCAGGVTENTSHVILDSTVVAGSGLLPGDRILAIWEDGDGNPFCAGQSGPYVPGLMFAIHPVSGERLGGAIALTIWMNDPGVPDPLDWPFGTFVHLVVEREVEWFLTIAVADAAPFPFPQLGPQPWDHLGVEQFFFLSAFIVLITTAAEGEGEGVVVAPYPNPSRGLVWLPYANVLHVFDLTGRLVAEGVGGRADLSPLARGVYILRSEAGAYLITRN